MVGAFTSVETYGNYLAALAGFRNAAEPWVEERATRPELGGWRPMRVRGEISADLADLGLMAVPADMPTMSNDIATLTGVLYVLEGSALGARVLVGRAQALGLTDRFGARHLSALASETQSWRSFLNVLETIEPFDTAHAVTAANATFAVALRAFGGHARAA